VSSYPAQGLSSTPRPQLVVQRRAPRLFAYECGSYIPGGRSLTISAVIHAIGIWLLAPIVFQAHIRIVNPNELAVSEPTVILYVPELPKLESQSQATSNVAPSTAGTLRRSAEQSLRATFIVSDPTEVLIAPKDIHIEADPSTLASILSSTPQAVKPGPQAIEIASGAARPREVAPKLRLDAMPVKAPAISVTANVKLGPQPIEIASGHVTEKAVKPNEIPVADLPTARPSLPVESSTTVRLIDAPAITSGSRTARLIGSPSGPAPAIEGTTIGRQSGAGLNAVAVQSGSAVRLIDAPTINGGSPNAKLVESPTGAAPNLEGSAMEQSGNTGLNIALGQPGVAVVLNPGRGSQVGTGPQQQGRIAAAINGVPSGRGLSTYGGGSSDTGYAGISPSEHADGVPGVGSRGVGGRPGSGASGTGLNSVAIDSSVVNIGSFGPPRVNGPLSGRRPSVVIVSSANAGSTLQRFAKTLKGQIYTMYLSASGTPAVMQFADQRSSRGSSFSPDLIAPETISIAMPKTARSGEEVVSCVLTKEGKLDAIRVLSDVSPDESEVLIAALKQWRFRPAYRETLPVDVDVVIGFGVNTN
jgi:hypothetical protein